MFSFIRRSGTHDATLALDVGLYVDLFKLAFSLQNVIHLKFSFSSFRSVSVAGEGDMLERWGTQSSDDGVKD